MRGIARFGVVVVTLAMLGAAGTVAVAGTASAGGLTMVELRPLPADDWAAAVAMNDRGVVVGVSVDVSEGGEMRRPVRWDRRGRVTALSTFGGTAQVNDVNDAGSAVGWAELSGGVRHAVLWTPDGSIVDLGAQQSEQYSAAEAINDRGAVVGQIAGRATLWRPNGRVVTLPSPPPPAWTLMFGIADDDTIIGEVHDPPSRTVVSIRWDGRGHRFTLYPRGVHLRDVAGRGWVAGSSAPEYWQPAYGTVWNPAGRITARSVLPGGSGSAATAVNRHGAAVGSGDVNGSYRAVRWDRFGAITELPGPPGFDRATGADIADDGTAVGYAEHDDWPFLRCALRWDRFGNVTELGTLPGATLGSTPIAINNRGMVLGYARDGSAYSRAVLWR